MGAREKNLKKGPEEKPPKNNHTAPKCPESSSSAALSQESTNRRAAPPRTTSRSLGGNTVSNSPILITTHYRRVRQQGWLQAARLRKKRCPENKEVCEKPKREQQCLRTTVKVDRADVPDACL